MIKEYLLYKFQNFYGSKVENGILLLHRQENPQNNSLNDHQQMENDSQVSEVLVEIETDLESQKENEAQYQEKSYSNINTESTNQDDNHQAIQNETDKNTNPSKNFSALLIF